jgi:hypothetical protein
MRRNYVSDILFKRSDQHLNDIVEQLKNGRTCIKTKLETGLMNKAKAECWNQKKKDMAQYLKQRREHDKRGDSDSSFTDSESDDEGCLIID